MSLHYELKTDVMILILLNFLQSYMHFSPPSGLYHYSTRMLLAAFTSLLFCLISGPYFIRKLYELKVGQTVRMDECPLLGKLHEKKKNTPTMGGILIVASMLLSLFLWMDLSHIYTLILLLTTLFLAVLGARDDYLKLKYKNTKGLCAKKKFIWQALLALMITSYYLIPGLQNSLQQNFHIKPPVIKEFKKEFKLDSSKPGKEITPPNKFFKQIYVPFVKRPFVVAAFLSFCLAFFTIVGSSNAANLTDGLDGLASGCLILIAAGMALFAFVSNHLLIASYLNIAYVEGSGEIAIYLAALIGATLGFLWYNSFPAQLFMGDTGSLTLGGIIGVSAVILRREFLLAILAGILVLEALSVIMQVISYKFFGKKRIFLCTPLHHHFEYLGWPETKVVIRFWIIGLMLLIISLVTLKFQ